jgi:hypothetical protein
LHILEFLKYRGKWAGYQPYFYNSLKNTPIISYGSSQSLLIEKIYHTKGENASEDRSFKVNRSMINCYLRVIGQCPLSSYPFLWCIEVRFYVVQYYLHATIFHLKDAITLINLYTCHCVRTVSRSTIYRTPHYVGIESV